MSKVRSLSNWIIIIIKKDNRCQCRENRDAQKNIEWKNEQINDGWINQCQDSLSIWQFRYHPDRHNFCFSLKTMCRLSPEASTCPKILCLCPAESLVARGNDCQESKLFFFLSEVVFRMQEKMQSFIERSNRYFLLVLKYRIFLQINWLVFWIQQKI